MHCTLKNQYRVEIWGEKNNSEIGLRSWYVLAITHSMRGVLSWQTPFLLACMPAASITTQRWRFCDSVREAGADYFQCWCEEQKENETLMLDVTLIRTTPKCNPDSRLKPEVRTVIWAPWCSAKYCWTPYLTTLANNWRTSVSEESNLYCIASISWPALSVTQKGGPRGLLEPEVCDAMFGVNAFIVMTNLNKPKTLFKTKKKITRFSKSAECNLEMFFWW